MIRLSMVVGNEKDRYLRRVLEAALDYIDDAVIIDDASTDGTGKMCGDILRHVPHRIIVNNKSMFHNEGELRYKQWAESVKDNPDWIMFLDADEIFEDSFAHNAKRLTASKDCTLYSFRLYDFWDEEHYRDDYMWKAHECYRPFLLKYVDGFDYQFNKSGQHCGRLPANAFGLPNELSQYRVKHYGWARPEDRTHKYNRYMELDPNGVYGSLAQYMSINDENPNLVKWLENSEQI